VAEGAESLLVPGAADVSALARNLIDNAVRYSPDGGRVSVRVGREPGDAGAKEGAAVLQVDDDGPGIPPADREIVFDRFVRRDDAADQTGSGLGLAIVRQVALRQGAEVALGDSPAGGLRVRVVWPAA
jgi:signal transduction histidine kinase